MGLFTKSYTLPGNATRINAPRQLKASSNSNRMIPANTCIVVKHPDTGQVIGLKGYCKRDDFKRHFGEIKELFGDLIPRPPEPERLRAVDMADEAAQKQSKGIAESEIEKYHDNEGGD
jgi:hypothetical protein